MLNRNALVVFVLLLCTGLFMALRDDADSRDTRANDLDRNTVTRIDVSTPRKVAELDTSIQPASDLITESKTRTAVEAEAPATAAPSAITEARGRIRGQVVAPNGTPLAGVQVQLKGFRSNPEKVLKYGAPNDWQDVVVETEADGLFAFRFDPPRAFQFTLRIICNGYANEGWRWLELAPAVDIEMGEIVLRPSGAIEGRIVNVEGEPIASTWTVLAEGQPGDGYADGMTSLIDYGIYDAVGQRFRLSHLPAGRTRLQAKSPLDVRIDGPLVDVVAGETVFADIVYEGIDLSRRIEVSTFTDPYYVLSGRVQQVRLTGPNLDRVAQKTPGRTQSFAFDDLDVGNYTVTIEDPLFKVFVRSGVRNGESVNAHLIPNAQLTLEVVDGNTKEAIASVRVRLRLEDFINAMPNTFEIHTGELPPGGLLPRILPGNTTLLVDAPGYSTSETPLQAMAAAETRHVRVELQGATELIGEVRHADGSLASDVQVLAMQPGQAPLLSEFAFGKERERAAVIDTWTDGSGQFRFSDLRPGHYDLYSIGNPWQLASAPNVEVIHGQVSRVKMRLPTGASLKLKLLNTDGPPPGKQVIFRTLAKPAIRSKNFNQATVNDIPLTEVSPTEWVAEGLPSGPGQVALVNESAEFSYLSTYFMLDGAFHPLADANLIDGLQTEVMVDFTGLEPGAIRIQVWRDGQPVSGLRVSARLGSENAGHTKTDNRGRARLEGLLPDAYQVSVYDPKLGEFRVPDLVQLAAGQTQSVVVDLSVVPGELIVRKPDGELLGSQRISVWCGGMVTAMATDSQGRLKLTMPTGNGQLDYPTHDPNTGQWTDAVATFDWPPPEGGVEVQLRFE